MSASGLKVEVKDSEITRYRPMLIISDDNMTGTTGYQRANWEMQRNNAEGKRSTVTVQGWQKPDGSLWLPNELVVLDAPQLGIEKKELLIVDCRYSLDDSGTKTQLTLMHREAFNEPPERLKNKSAKKSNKDNVKEFSAFLE
ncbi:phage tail protein [Pasteurella multocida subsp. multocida]|uniref:Phage tail protein n=1 Tax=Pasteurella multocida TaxID=747 RepID=A0A9X3ZLE4_PASMD|nr:phage tail protein [Pasteurella multocida]MBF6980343.1 phage tail protein [Pasteurella multocida]MBF6985711.1 phage tail protein [Pasteurella multocida]MDA5607624.1 phage tail protein [Pasteurella multocida subsp. multocida]MDA5611543.1 phage tail protein [Pasteurella multocida]MDA5614029.1 phage tail protein [Pasteurella multocida]